MTDWIGDLAFRELVERFRSGSQVLGQPIVLHCGEDTRIMHHRSDSTEFRTSEMALELDRLAKGLEHLPLWWPQLISRPIGLPLFDPDRGNYDRLTCR